MRRKGLSLAPAHWARTVPERERLQALPVFFPLFTYISYFNPTRIGGVDRSGNLCLFLEYLLSPSWHPILLERKRRHRMSHGMRQPDLPADRHHHVPCPSILPLGHAHSCLLKNAPTGLSFLKLLLLTFSMTIFLARTARS